MTIFHYWNFFVTAFWIFWTYWVLKSKKSKMQLQKIFNNEKWCFYHKLSSPIQKIKKNKFLENFGPLGSNFWTWICSGKAGIEICWLIGQNQARIKFLLKSLFEEPTWFYVVHPNLDPTLGVAMGVKGGLSFYVGVKGR